MVVSLLKPKNPPLLHMTMISSICTSLPSQVFYLVMFWLVKHWWSTWCCQIFTKRKRPSQGVQLQVSHYLIQFCTSFKLGGKKQVTFEACKYKILIWQFHWMFKGCLRLVTWTLQNLVRFYIFNCWNLEYVVGSCLPKFKHLIIEGLDMDSNASCVALFFCSYERRCCMQKSITICNQFGGRSKSH
jgi:hypothetical protein